MNVKRINQLNVTLALAAVALASLALVLSVPSTRAQENGATYGYDNDLVRSDQVPLTIITGTSVITHYIFLPFVAQDYDPSWVWNEATTPNLTPGPSSVPLMSIDRQGRVHLLWDTFATNPQFIYHSFLDAQGWTTPTIVASSLGASYVSYPPAVGQDGRLHLVWRNSLTYQGPRRLLYAAFDGTQWSAEEEVYRVESPFSLQGISHLDTVGQVHVTFESGTMPDLYHIVREGGAWSAPVKIPRFNIIAPRVWWPDQRGGVHVYEYGYSNTIYYSYWRAGQFLVENAPATGTLSGLQTQLDGLNNLHLFWTDYVPVPGGSVRGLHHQCLSDDLEWGDVQVPTEGRALSYPDLLKATDWGARFALVWQEESSNQIRVGVWQDCVLSDVKTIPVPEGTWLPLALAMSDAPNKICLLARMYSLSYTVVCVDILD